MTENEKVKVKKEKKVKEAEKLTKKNILCW